MALQHTRLPATSPSAFLLGILLAMAAAAHAGEPRVTGSLAGSVSGDGFIHGSFTCDGAPVCKGTYDKSAKYAQCSNAFHLTGALEIDGLHLDAPRALSGYFTFRKFAFYFDRLPDGSCVIRDTPHRRTAGGRGVSGRDSEVGHGARKLAEKHRS